MLRMSTPSNNKQELILEQIKLEIFRVAKKDALTHALAIGFSNSNISATKVQIVSTIVSLPLHNIPTSQVHLPTSSVSNSSRTVRSKIADPRNQKQCSDLYKYK